MGAASTLHTPAAIDAERSRQPAARQVNAMQLDVPSGGSQFATASVLLPRSVRVLMIEDDPDWRETIAEFLRAERFEVDTAENGLAGLLYLRSARPLPQVVLLDLEMPIMDGRGFLAEARRDPTLRALPVVVFSSSARDDVRVRLALDKSCAPEALVGILRAVAT
jgi:CheY-like chemotaxis protein